MGLAIILGFRLASIATNWPLIFLFIPSVSAPCWSDLALSPLPAFGLEIRWEKFERALETHMVKSTF
ncbi:hypothetical protein K1719_033415 [Acacia pycnantha]|nr:hypothetical protein K1719_033415 [Acacia pycnantha]